MKTLTAKQYCPNLRPDWSIQNEIIKRVQRESECSVEIEQPPIPKYEKGKKSEWSKTALRAFASQVVSGLMP